MLLWTVLVFAIWITVWQFFRARDRRLDAGRRLVARRRIRALAKQRDHLDKSESD
jgi:hypothetical protein